MFSPKKTLAFLATLTFIVATTMAKAGEGEPSDDAKGMPGALGTFEFKPYDWQEGQTTWWKDSDGVDPGTAGCHIGTDAEGEPYGRFFGEACLTGGRLVESNPGAGVLHSHKNDVGHPDQFDCEAWCVGQGAPGGVCVMVESEPCGQSAMCSCDQVTD